MTAMRRWIGTALYVGRLLLDSAPVVFVLLILLMVWMVPALVIAHFIIKWW